MKNDRIEQIKATLSGLGPQAGMRYTIQEIIDSLIELQNALARGVFEKTHAENLRNRDIVIHFEALAKEYGLDQTDTFIRFKKNMQDLSYTIGSYIKGVKGEKAAHRELKLLSYDKGVRILYNVQLEDVDTRAEYDAIAITPYGLFVIEVKNWGSSVTISGNGLLSRNDEKDIVYDLPGRMSIKQALLEKYLGENFPNNYQNILLFSDGRVTVKDWYKKIPIVCGGGISYKIREFDSHECSLSENQIADIEKAIMAHHKAQKMVSPVNCDEIIADYATLMAQIEASSAETATSARKAEDQRNDAESHTTREKWYTAIDWRMIGKRAAGIAVIVPAIACGLLLLNKYSI